MALSGILSQTDDSGNLRPVAYYSKKLTPAEQWWQVHDQELGAIVACFTEWRCWLTGTNEPVVVLSDHANLRFFMTAQHLTPRQARWASLLSMFNFEVLHTPGKLNPADPASRRPDYVAGKHVDDKIILLGFRSVSLDTSDICALTMTFPPRTSVDISFMPADSFILHCLRQLYDSDSLVKDGTCSFLTLRDDLWWWRDRLYVPESFRQFLIGKFHGDPASGHWGVFRTLHMISQTFSWPQMRADVLSFIASCARCQQIKVDHQKTQGELLPLPVPDRPWSTIGVDFIVKLPLSSTFDSIMVVVDHLTKAEHFIPANETWDASELAKHFLASVFKLHGLPDKIVSDRGATFISRFWTAIMTQLRIQPAPLTAFHLQKDGQVERVNAILEDYL